MIPNVWAIARREIQAYFASPIAYVVLGLFAFFFGFFFYFSLAEFINTSAGRGMGMPPEVLNLNQDMIFWLFTDTASLLLFIIPLLTMRSFSEEIRSGTIELLLTAPLTDFQIVAGKFLGTVVLYLCMLGITLLHMSTLFLFGDPEWKPVLVGYLGIFLLGSALISLGLVFSAMTRNQIVAGVITLVAFLFLAIFQSAERWAGAGAGFVSYLSAPKHFEAFAKGVLESRGVVYYLSFIGLGLVLSKQSLESLRWKG